MIILLSAVLRLLWLGKFPPSLYTDEADQGYNAYSILLTGKDEHGILLPLSFRSFGDWKPPLPTYLMIPPIAFLGLTEEAIRLPSAVLGIGTVILTFFLTKELLKGRKKVDSIALLAAFFLAISPWHILQSRAAMLVLAALFFLELGIFSFLKGLTKPRLLYLSSVSFVFSIYSYYGFRVVTPLIVITLLSFFRREIWLKRKDVIYSFFLSILLLLPLGVAFLQNPDVVFGRAKTVSVFYDQGIKLRQWELIAQDGITASPLISRFFHNSLYLYGQDIVRRFLSHLDGRFLFLVGDQSPPFQIPKMGILYLIDGIFLLSGLIFLFWKKFFSRNVIIFWLLISLLPASFTFMTPSSNRIFSMIVPLMILTSMGLIYSRKLIGRKFLINSVISLLYIINFGYFLHQYFIGLPNKHADWWTYGWKEIVNYVSGVKDKYENIVVSNAEGMPYIYFLIYEKIDSLKFQKEAIRPYVADQFGYEHVDGFDKYIFVNNLEWKDLKNNLQKNTLYIIPARQAQKEDNYLKTIYYPDGRPMVKIFAYE